MDEVESTIAQALKERSPSIGSLPELSARLSAVVEATAPELDRQGQRFALGLLGARPPEDAWRGLLALTAALDPSIAYDAAQALGGAPAAPPIEALAKAASRSTEALVRGSLYLFAGRQSDPGALAAVRALREAEADPGAADDALAAAVKLGGEPEWHAFLARVEGEQGTDPFGVCERLDYIGDVRLARGLLPWLSNRSPIGRLMSDANPAALRLCDLAVVEAHGLGVSFSFPRGLGINYADEVLSALRSALEALPSLHAVSVP